MKRPELPDDVIASYVGDGAPALIGRALGSEAGDEKLVRSGLEYFLSYYREHKLDHTHLYDGITGSTGDAPELTTACRAKWPCSPISRCTLRGPLSRPWAWANSFRGFTGATAFPPRKPDPEGAQTILREMGAGPQETMIVGDSGVDVLTGRNAGTWTCGVTYGFAPHTLHDPPPHVLLDQPSELAELFARSPVS